eukprot:TRINITY_DN9427_c0_g1_i1.p2 TRINITY_DN9427_c0_g1~~TRINITY_DN9427_c0_g1_i1.p2  ORF type:complete len:289 (+),score=124.12 TRINITY_DN9427_c0_g1_i1:176-1042(+)
MAAAVALLAVAAATDLGEMWVAGPDGCGEPKAAALPGLDALGGFFSGGAAPSAGVRAVRALKAAVVAQDQAVGVVGHYFRQWIDGKRGGTLLMLRGGKGSGKSMTTRVLSSHADAECAPLMISGLSLASQAEVVRWLLATLPRCPRTYVVVDDAHHYDLAAAFADIPFRFFAEAFIIVVDYPEAASALGVLEQLRPVAVTYRALAAPAEVGAVARHVLKNLLCRHALEALVVAEAVLQKVAAMCSGAGGAREVAEVVAREIEPRIDHTYRGAEVAVVATDSGFGVQRL